MELAYLNRLLRRSGSLVAEEIGIAIPMTRHGDGHVVAYRRRNPVFPAQPWVVHIVTAEGAMGGEYDLTRDDAIQLARERTGQ